MTNDAPMEWQPNRTAPKDGTEFLGAIGGVIEIYRYENGRFWDGFSSVPPEFWMPLPPPPCPKGQQLQRIAELEDMVRRLDRILSRALVWVDVPETLNAGRTIRHEAAKLLEKNDD